MTTLTLGTRGSPLALAQAAMVAAALERHGATVAVVVVVTTGDRVQDRPLAEIGGKALWTKELDAALLDRRIDLAVHSMKDVETHLPAGIALAAMLPRADVRDRLIGAASLAALPMSARLGTSSPRRAAQVRWHRPDVTIVPLRGNVATRLAKIAAGEADATLLAAAGLDRLGLAEGHPLDLLPAPAQGAVGMACRTDDAATRARLAAIDDAPTHAAVRLERGFLARLGADCHSPVAALARVDGGRVTFRAELLAPDGGERVAAGGDFAAPLGAAGDFAATLGAAGDFAAEAADGVAAVAADLLARASPGLRALFAD